MSTHLKTAPAPKAASPLLLVMLLTDSMHFVWAGLLANYLHPFASAFWVLAVATVEVGVYMGVRRMIRLEVLRQHFWFFASVGLLVAAATALSYTAITFIDPGTASLFARSSTVFTLLLGVVWLREHFTKIEGVGALFCIVGATVIGLQPIGTVRIGVLVLLGATFSYALHNAVVKKYGDEIEFANFFLFRVGGTAVFLILFLIPVALQGEPLWPETGRVWGIYLLVGTMDVVVSRVVYYATMRQMRLSVHTIILTLSPVLTVLWTLLFFGVSPTWLSAVGGLIVLVGIVIIARGKTTKN